MRLLIDDTFATSGYTVPLAEGWVTSDGLPVDLVTGLTAAEIGAEDAALAPAMAVPALLQSHEIIPEFAVIADGVGAVAMRTPVRPDEITATPVRLLDAPGAELLARATLRPFYGIEPTAWLHNADSPEAVRAEVVIVDGAEALREPEGGFSEDLSRAWFILTNQPVVSHLLLAPREQPPDERQRLLEFLRATRDTSVTRRREWRMPLADREGIDRDRAGAFWAAQRLTLEAEDRQALLDLLHKGSSGTSRSALPDVKFYDGAETM